MTNGCFLTVKDPLGKSSIPSKGALTVVIRWELKFLLTAPPCGEGGLQYLTRWGYCATDGKTDATMDIDKEKQQEEWVVKTGSWVRRKLRKTTGDAVWEHLGFNSWSEIPLGDGYLVRMQCLSTSGSLQCLDVRSGLSVGKTGLFGTRRVGRQISYIFWWALTSTFIFVLFSTRTYFTGYLWSGNNQPPPPKSRGEIYINLNSVILL